MADDKLRHITNSSGQWEITVVDPTSENNVGVNSSLVLDHNGFAYVSYCYACTGGVGDERLKFATNKSGSWQYTFVPGEDGDGSSTSLSSSNGMPVISHYNDGIDKLRVTRYQQGDWVNDTVDVATFNRNIVDITLDNEGLPYIVYDDYICSHIDDIPCVMVSWISHGF